ncbi:VOC family protein [Paenisporosarcina cavernae]|uniref:VOC family protein n=1 Tax=Paenisporosarcina cavernae TaxID=2320858 RepID=A0A385YVP0_9BACL|nr:VOC family protein [Paenisporosarcina cavernae]AYC30541.1 VOC family protein [Paenisporosarcina cavernae]
MPIIAYLNFNGNTEEVIHFYEEVFGTEAAQIQYFKDMPGQQVDDETANRVLHGRLEVYGTPLYFSDSMPHSPVSHGDGMTLAVVGDDAELMKTQFDALAKSGKIIMPLQETFWSKAYGMVEDRFGVQWQFSHEA